MFTTEEMIGTLILGFILGVVFIFVWSAILMSDEKNY